MPEMLAVALEAAAVLLAFGAALGVAGYGLTRLLAPAPLRAYALMLMPAVGASALIVGSYFLNLLVNLVVALGLMLAAAVALDTWLIARRGWWLPRPTRPQWVVLGFAAVLLIVAFLPHLHGRSLAMLGLNIDEELYVPLAELLKSNSVFMRDAALGPFQSEFQTVANHSRGWGFPYLLTIGSLLSNEPAFHAYVPVLYLLLALSVPAAFIFGRGALGVSERTAALGASLYALHGLPLWFTGMGFGPHTVSFLLFPVAMATAVVAVRGGGRGAIGLAALSSAAVLVSYFWAISAVYLAVAVVLATALIAVGEGRLRRLRNLAVLGLAIGALAAPGLYWLIRFAAPLLSAIATDMNAQFGNAWGDTQFARVELAFGLAPYRLAADAGPWGDLIGPGGVDALTRVKDALFWPALALAVLGLATLRGQRHVAWALAGAYALFMYWVAEGAAYQYGHLKNLSYVAYFVTMLLAVGISNLFHGRFAGWSQARVLRLGGWLPGGAVALRGVGLAAAVVLGLALVHNTYQTVWWYWRGVGWNVDRRVAHDARTVAALTPPGSRVYFAHGLTYPLPVERILLSDHVLGFHFPEHQISSWTARARGVWAGVLTEREVYGFAGGIAFSRRDFSDDEAYDFMVLNAGDDPRSVGLLASDALYQTPYWTFYRVPHDDRLTANGIAAANDERLDVPVDRPLRLGLRDGRLALGGQLAPAGFPIVFGAVTAQPATLRLRADGAEQRLALEPGLTWITSPAPSATALEIQSEGSAPTIHIVAARLRRGVGVGVTSLTTEHLPRAVFSVDVRTDGARIQGSIIAINPTGRGRNIGLSYQESETQGFWRSAALVVEPAQRIDFVYDPLTREFVERIDGGDARVTRARDAQLGGGHRLEARMEHSFIGDFSAPLLDYSVSGDRIANATLFRRVYTPDLIPGP